jgi:hypothetical protein
LKQLLLLILFVQAALAIVLLLDAPASAQQSPVEFVDFGMESQFPEGMRFFGTINSSLEVEDVRVTYEVGDRHITQYNYLDLVSTPDNPGFITGDLFVNTNSPERYVPPGSVIKYQLEVLAANGESYLSEHRETLLLDARFEWDTVTDGPVTVYYHGPVQSRAETLAAKTSEGLGMMGPVTGAEIETPIAIMLYNNNAEMIKAVVPRSATISRELITEGQAFGEENTVLVLAGRSDIGTATHEITHILVDRASNGATLVPFWLNEGLAEFGNLDKTISYTRYLEWAVGTGRLPTLKSLNRAPGDPNLTLVGYGSGRSAVNFMVTEFGPEKMASLLAALGSGIPIQDAIPVVYEMSFEELENRWRTSIGADLYVAPTVTPTSSAPTATPTPGALLPLTLDEIAAAGQATATPAVEPTAGATAVLADDATATPASSGGGSCNAVGNNGPAQATPLLGISALLMIGVWRFMRREERTKISDK